MECWEKKKSVDHWRTLNFRRRDCMSGVSFPDSHHRGDEHYASGCSRGRMCLTSYNT